MEYDDKDSADLEAELYSRIHHDKPDAHDIVSEPPPPPTIQYQRTVTKHSIVNNNKMNKKTSTKNRKKAITNPNPFAIVALNCQNPIPKRLTPYTSYLSQVDSRPIDIPPAPINDILLENKTKSNDQRPNPFNQGFNRAEEKMKRFQLMKAKKAQADKIRDNIQQKKEATRTAQGEIAASSIFVPDSESDDEVYIYPPEKPAVISISDDDGENVVDENSNEADTIDNLQDDCNDINVDYEKRLSRRDDPFGGIDAAELNKIVSQNSSIHVAPVTDTSDNFAKPQRANRHSLKRSYEVTETDFAATDVYESESSDLPESSFLDKGQRVTTVLSEIESEGSEIDITKRSKRMRKRKSSGSNRGSDCISSDDSDEAGENVVEHEKINRSNYLFRGEGVYNAITKFRRRDNTMKHAQHQRMRNVEMDAADSSDTNNSVDDEEEAQGNVAEEQGNIEVAQGKVVEERGNVEVEQGNVENEQGNVEENWIVKDQVGEPDDILLSNVNSLEKSDETVVNDNDNVDEEESDVDKDDANSVRSKRLVLPLQLGWNNEMSAFYNDSWGGETHNTKAIRKQMPRDSFLWQINDKDRTSNYNVLKAIKCHNCRETGHRMAFCPQPRKELVCYTCGYAGHREVRCPYAICLKCGEKTNSYRRGCERCFRMSGIICRKCRRRGHMAGHCPDNWRAYHNTTDAISTPARLPIATSRKYCSACAGVGHRAEQCYDYQLLLQDDIIPNDIRQYEKVYRDDIPPIDNSMTTPYSLLENPRENFKFNWNVNESSNRFYGRFMEAAKIRRDPVNTKQRKRARIPKLDDSRVEENDEKLVLNPMNVQNIREKPKKQFRKNFYEEPSEAPSKDDETSTHCDDVQTNVSEITTNSREIKESCDEPKTVENVDQVTDVEMKEVEGCKAEPNIDKEICDRPSVDQLDDDLMREAIEVDQLRGAQEFSFTKEMEELNKSKCSFNLSFIGTASDDNNSKISKSNVNKIRKEAEINHLTEMEISLNKLKVELNKKKPNDNYLLNISNTTDQSIHSIHDSDSNYSFGEYFNDGKSKEKEPEKVDNDLPDYIPLPPDIGTDDMLDEVSNSSDFPTTTLATSQAKIFLTKEHARLLLSTEAGNRLLSDAFSTHKVKVRMDWENLGNVLVVIGSKVDQNKFHADLIKFLVDICKKMRIRNETFQQLPRSKVALVRFIREQFALLNQPLGNVNELYKNMIRNERLNSKNGTKNADRARKNLNVILMGRAGLREGRFHLAGLENNLKFLLEQTKDMMTKQTREDIYHHYRYIFSPFEHDNYPELLSEYEDLRKANNLPTLNIDQRLLEFNINVKNDEIVELNRAKQKLMIVSNAIESPQTTKEVTEVETIVPRQSAVVPLVEPKTPTREHKITKPKTPKQQPKSPKQELKLMKMAKVHTENDESSDVSSIAAVEGESSIVKNEIWSLKCKDIVEKCQQKHIKSSKVVQKLNTVLEKASKNQLSQADYKNLEKILNTLNRTVN